MELINTKEFTQVAKLKNFGGENMAKVLMSVLKLDKINEIYSQHYTKPAFSFIEGVLKDTGINYEILPEDLFRIPKAGAFIMIANHPFGGLEGIILLHILLKIRPDTKFMGNFLLQKIEPIKECIIPVNPFEDQTVTAKNVHGLKLCREHLESGKPLVIFPAGEVSTFQNGYQHITDKPWNKSAVKFIKKAQVPVVPVYFNGTNSNTFHWLGIIHPLLRTAKIPSEILNKKEKPIKLRIGNPISIEEQNLFQENSRFGRFLRAKTYTLNTLTDINPFFKTLQNTHSELLIPAIPKKLLIDDILRMPDKYELLRYKNFVLYCCPTIYIPNIINEIGRLRELTFREIGEGTNKSMDIDEFDLYYRQLFIWDDENKSIVGGYRVGLGKEIINQYGIKGFYTRSLFKMNKKMIPVLEQSIELGRSFITLEYQKKTLSLFLLWKGILMFLVKNNEYRYLVGPVSISDNFSAMSQQLIVEFIKNNYLHPVYSNLIKPRKPFVPKFDVTETEILTQETADLGYMDQIIKDIESNNNRLPVLLKKYLMLGGRIAAFNVDPAFNNSLDGFLVLDLADVPSDMIMALSKELELGPENVQNRFRF